MLLKTLPSAVIVIFRRYFGSSSLSLFYKIVVLKTSAKLLAKHTCRRRSFSLKFYHKLKTASLIFFNEFCKIFVLRTFFLQGFSGRLLVMFRKLNIQTFNSKQIISLDQYCWHAILVHKTYTNHYINHS